MGDVEELHCEFGNKVRTQTPDLGTVHGRRVTSGRHGHGEGLGRPVGGPGPVPGRRPRPERGPGTEAPSPSQGSVEGGDATGLGGRWIFKALGWGPYCGGDPWRGTDFTTLRQQT